MGKVLLFTDGAARGNPDGPGGYGAVLQFTDSKGQLHEKTLSAGYVRTVSYTHLDDFQLESEIHRFQKTSFPETVFP